MQKDRMYDVCIIGGCGHVGLPLGMALADRGKKVVLYDINEKSIESVNKKQMPFMEEHADKLLGKVVENKKLSATNDTSVIKKSEVLVMVIGTPVDEHLNPRLHDVIKAIKEIEKYLDDEQLLVLRSTLYPGASYKIHDYLHAIGKVVDVAFCPERIAEGKALTELYDLPQIVSGCRPTAVKRAKELFSTLTNKVIELEPTEAELAKLYSNTWRYINFAISNQFYMIADMRGLDFYKIRDAMVEDYPRLKSYAKAGFAAGPCLFKDTMQLSAFSQNNFFLGHAAMLINEGLPNYIVERLKLHNDLKDMTVGILGMAFKSNSDDPRESLSFKLKKILEVETKKVLCTDAHMKLAGLVSLDTAVKQSDILIVAAPHDEYKDLNLTNKHVVDIWNFYNQGGIVK